MKKIVWIKEEIMVVYSRDDKRYEVEFIPFAFEHNNGAQRWCIESIDTVLESFQDKKEAIEYAENRLINMKKEKRFEKCQFEAIKELDSFFDKKGELKWID